jgi:hypothetical protein
MEKEMNEHAHPAWSIAKSLQSIDRNLELITDFILNVPKVKSQDGKKFTIDEITRKTVSK